MWDYLLLIARLLPISSLTIFFNYWLVLAPYNLYYILNYRSVSLYIHTLSSNLQNFCLFFIHIHILSHTYLQYENWKKILTLITFCTSFHFAFTNTCNVSFVDIDLSLVYFLPISFSLSPFASSLSFCQSRSLLLLFLPLFVLCLLILYIKFTISARQ